MFTQFLLHVTNTAVVILTTLCLCGCLIICPDSVIISSCGNYEIILVTNPTAEIVQCEFELSVPASEYELNDLFDVEIIPNAEKNLCVIAAEEQTFNAISVSFTHDRMTLKYIDNITLGVIPKVTIYTTLPPGKLSLTGIITLQITEPFKVESLTIRGSATSKLIINEATVERLNLNISGVSKLNGTINAEEAQIHVSGVSKINGTGDIGEMIIKLSGSSKFNWNGTIDEVECKASGSAKMDFLHVKDFKCNASGSAKITIAECETVEASLSGAAKLIASGAVVKKMNTSGSAKFISK